jgi:hypothetical protein
MESSEGLLRICWVTHWELDREKNRPSLEHIGNIGNNMLKLSVKSSTHGTGSI